MNSKTGVAFSAVAIAVQAASIKKVLAIEQACNHQCSKCGILYHCEGCLGPFFTYKHDCKLRARI